jgi:hypothetical protein
MFRHASILPGSFANRALTPSVAGFLAGWATTSEFDAASFRKADGKAAPFTPA